VLTAANNNEGVHCHDGHWVGPNNVVSPFSCYISSPRYNAQSITELVVVANSPHLLGAPSQPTNRTASSDALAAATAIARSCRCLVSVVTCCIHSSRQSSR